MHPNLLLPIFRLLMITTLALIHISKSFCHDHQQYTTCGEPFQCGKLSFVYPFWGGNRQSSCGYPGFNLNCQDDSVTFLAFESVRYRVLAIDDSRHSLTVSRDDLWNDLCPRFVYDTTFNYSIFRYSSDYQNVTLYYGCTITIPNFSRQENQFDCPGNTAMKTTSFYSTATFGNINRTAIRCNSSISVPVKEAATKILRNSEDLRAALGGGFGLEWKADNQVCNQCTRSGGRCGHNSNTSSFVCYCSDRPYNLTCGNTRNDNGKRRIIFGVVYVDKETIESRRYERNLVITSGVVGGFLLLIVVIYYFAKRSISKQAEKINQNIVAFMRNYVSSAPKYYSFAEIKRMTGSFADRLGQGGFGSVYKGKLSDGRQVAVKVLRDRGNGEDFINEVASISRTSHVNVVALLGFCYKANNPALIYEYMSNGSLDKFICKNKSLQDADSRLEWKVLYKIALGTARGLEYLHQGCNTRIVHFDIKPHNILLDEDFCPKISDFGLAKLCKKKQSVLSTMSARGTIGYVAPEVVIRELGGVSHKSDVYSYGIMVLEMVGLKRRIQVDSNESNEKYFPNWIYERLDLEKGLKLEGVMNAEEEETAMKMILVGLWCIQTKPSDRPSMSKVVEMLEGSIQSLQIPPKPHLLDSLTAVISTIKESSSTSLA